jgi:hypothetical protein
MAAISFWRSLPFFWAFFLIGTVWASGLFAKQVFVFGQSFLPLIFLT